MNASEVFDHCPIMPVVVIENLDVAVPLAHALLEGGINTMEITLRTQSGLAAIKKVSKEVPKMLVGAGTVLTPTELSAAIDNGAQYIITPGITMDLLEAGTKVNVPMIPGVSNASTIMQAHASGYQCLKFFPALVNGGIAALKNFAGPFPQIKFCPTGGVNKDNLADFLALDNVFCVGGSWMIDRQAISKGDFTKIAELTRNAIDSI